MDAVPKLLAHAIYESLGRSGALRLVAELTAQLAVAALVLTLLCCATASAQEGIPLDVGQVAAPSAGEVAATGANSNIPNLQGAVANFGLFSALLNGIALPINNATAQMTGALAGWVNGWFPRMTAAMLRSGMLWKAWVAPRRDQETNLSLAHSVGCLVRRICELLSLPHRAPRSTRYLAWGHPVMTVAQIWA
jgi:hypothetical protein